MLLEPCEWDDGMMELLLVGDVLILVLGLRSIVGLVVAMSLFGLHSLMERVRSSSCTDCSIHISSARGTVHLKY